MPAKATVFNSKCDKVFDYGTGSRNMALYNPQGNLLLLGGFGNLRGNVEIWSEAAKERKEVAKFDAPGRQFNSKVSGLSFGLKNGLRFLFDPQTCQNYPFLNIFVV